MNKFFEKWSRVKARHTKRVVLIPASVFYIAFNEDAEKLHEILSLELNKAKKSEDGFESFARITHLQLNDSLRKLLDSNQPVCVADR